MLFRHTRLQTASSLALAAACLIAPAAWAQTAPIRIQRPPAQREAPPQRPLSDLTIVAIREESDGVVADVRNIGVGASPATTVALYVAGRQVAELGLAVMGAGETRSVRFDRPAGAASVQVMVDPTNRVPESNETNNRPPNFALREANATGRAPLVRRPVDTNTNTALSRRPIRAMPDTPAEQAPPAPDPAHGRPPRPIGRASAAQAVTEIVPPLTKAQPPTAGVLRARRFSEMMSGFSVKRTIPIATIRANPIVTLAGEKLDFRPMLANQAALPNLAQRLRAQPQIATVLGERTEVVEIDRGLIVRNFLSYRLRPGVCTDPNRAALVRRAGAQCASPVDANLRAQAMADPNSARYIADSKQRAATLLRASSDTAKQMKAIRGYLPQLRASLANPEAAGEIGADEAKRLSGLSDDQLLAEIAGTATVNTEEYAFVPIFKPIANPFLTGIDPTPYKATFADWGKKPGTKPLSGHHDLPTQYFLTGFTTGRNYEWRKRAEVTIDWCLVGCSETYYAEVHATFGYAFGLRFPIELSGKYEFENGMAFVTPTFKPINANATTYGLTGLPAAQVYQGKEFVAEVEFSAGLNYKVPILGEDGISVGDKLDFTDFLEKPFAGGEVLPPPPGESSAPMVKVIDQIDLLGGRADFGIAGARVHPIIEVTLQATDLHFTLRDEGNGKPFEAQVKSGERKRLTYDPVTKVSKFSIGDPVYALDFLITPGIRPKLFVDVAVWSYDWHTDLTFPQFALKLPPGGATFSCHAKTVCARNYEFSPDAAKESQGAMAAASNRFDPSEAPPHWYWGKATPDKRPTWAQQFDDKFFGKCPAKDKSKECEGKLKSIRFEALLQMSAAPALSRDEFKDLKPSAFLSQSMIDSAILADVMKRFDAAVAKADKDAAYAVQFYQERYK